MNSICLCAINVVIHYFLPWSVWPLYAITLNSGKSPFPSDSPRINQFSSNVRPFIFPAVCIVLPIGFASGSTASTIMCSESTFSFKFFISSNKFENDYKVSFMSQQLRYILSINILQLLTQYPPPADSGLLTRKNIPISNSDPSLVPSEIWNVFV